MATEKEWVYTEVKKEMAELRSRVDELESKLDTLMEITAHAINQMAGLEDSVAELNAD